MNHIAHVPLAGGFALAAINVTKKYPIAITSYSPFINNDALLIRYLNENLKANVPYYILNKEKDLNDYDFSKEIDFVTAIPPCSGLSQAAQRKAGSRGTAPPNDWMYISAEYVLEKIRPKAYAFENAPGLYTDAGNEVRKKLIEIGKKYGYAIIFYKTNTLYHGIPQFRPRTYGVFFKGKYAPIFNYYNRPYINLKDYLKQIPENASLQDVFFVEEWDITKFEIYKFLVKLYGNEWREKLINYRPHITTYDYLLRTGKLDEFYEFQKNLPDASEIVTRNIEHIKRKKSQGKGTRISYRVLEIDKEYTYAVIGEMMQRKIHPTEDRLLNMREFMHLMGLPHDYNLISKKEYVKITQNVPVKTSEDIIIEIIETIHGNRRFSSDSVYMQDNTKPKYYNKSKKLF